MKGWEYHGLHIAAPAKDHDRVEWFPSVPRVDRVRVRDHTCCVCDEVVFELCTAGGLWFVRRLTVSAPVSVVESEWQSAREAVELWRRLLRGQAR
ncbi:hypothetical protein HNR30_006843 [Nonomuraea soli]|uniref:Uncharacterized protein n=1 Tax=Nonomuraea soli TaxID=1032476 RepID=A0A7W0CQM3_9ACTN|nr:hypothetical protein [Nonomuraea soli]